MKYIIPALLMAFCVNAQSLSINDTDKTTGGRTIVTKNFEGSEIAPDDTVARNGLVFFSAGYQEIKKGKSATEIYYIELNIVHKDSRLGCLNQGQSKIVLELEDGSVIECNQISDTDCDPVGFMTAFALMPKGGAAAEMKSNFEKLKTVGIKKIDLFTTEKEIGYNIKNKKLENMKAHFALLAATIAK